MMMPKTASVQMVGEKHPAGWPAQWPECKRRAGARNKKIDRAVIYHLQNVFASRLRPQVIKRRSEVNKVKTAIAKMSDPIKNAESPLFHATKSKNGIPIHRGD